MRARDNSLDAAVAEQAQKAVRASDIARNLGVTPNRVHSVLNFLRRHGAEFPPVRSGPRPGLQGPRLTRLNAELRSALAPHAAARGMSARALAARILEIVTREDLVDAILDDGEDRT
jgi:hypothetical protein